MTKKRHSMLTSSQLSDLFTRLDKNADGELDLHEFAGIVKMLKVEVSHDFIAHVFRSVNQRGTSSNEKSGSLDMQGFMAAYQIVYTDQSDRVTSISSPRASLIRATRYGCRGDGSYLFECYVISSNNSPEKYTLDDLPNNETSLGLAEDGACLIDLSKARSELWLVNNKLGTMKDLDLMMRQDSAHNKNTRASVFWWVDCAFTMVDHTTAEELVATFGLPNCSKFVSSFGNFGNGLSTNPTSRVSTGSGINTHGSVHSVSFFAQAQSMRNLPVVHHLPPLFDRLQSSLPSHPHLKRVADTVQDYYNSRFAWVANLSWLSRTVNDEKRSAYERAESLASLFKNSDLDESEDVNERESVGQDDIAEDCAVKAADKHTLFSSNGAGVPLRSRVGYNYPPSWLRTTSQINASPPKVSVDSISLHLLDYGFGAHALVTVRQIDTEKQKHLTLEQQSRAGVLGRIVSGVWVKLAKVIMSGRNAGEAGELTDSPASLMTFLFLLIHNFSMNSVASVDYWLGLLEKEIKDIVVSKHNTHLVEVERILKDFNSYLNPFEEFMQMLAQWHEGGHLNEGSGLESVGSHDDYTSMKKKRRASLLLTETKALRRRPSSTEKLALPFATISKFLGINPYREIRRQLDGYEQLDLKGLIYWQERLRNYAGKVKSHKQLLAAQLNEKRNFMFFVLTIVTAFLAPLSIITNYYKMKFTNMVERDAEETPFPRLPGVVFMWVITGAIYCVMLIFVLHFRVLYAAT